MAKRIDKRMRHLREMEEIVETTTMDIWAAVDQAQLSEYEKVGPKEITLGDIGYKITKYFMDDNNVPNLALVAVKSRSTHTIFLSMVWSEYQNYSTLDNNGREELRRKYFL